MKFEEKFIVLTTMESHEVAIDPTQIVQIEEIKGGHSMLTERHLPRRTRIELKKPDCSVVVTETLGEIQSKWYEWHLHKANKNKQEEVQ